MIGEFQIRQGYTAPWLEIVITKSGYPIRPSDTMNPCVKAATQNSEEPIDLTDKIVTPKMWKCGRTPLEKALAGSLEITDAVNGVVVYKWAPSDTDTVGFFMFGVEVYDPDTGSRLLWPYLKEQLTIEVTP